MKYPVLIRPIADPIGEKGGCSAIIIRTGIMPVNVRYNSIFGMDMVSRAINALLILPQRKSSSHRQRKNTVITGRTFILKMRYQLLAAYSFPSSSLSLILKRAK
ncbi:MAG: hypothetical protein JXA20_17285 [Spirochaetes bacterium]|nr:hypothetical protein [Spirochaetota bacterium]